MSAPRTILLGASLVFAVSAHAVFFLVHAAIEILVRSLP